MLLDVLTSIHPSMDLTSEEHLAVFFNDPRESSTPSPSDCTLVLTLTFQPFRLPLLFARHLVKLRQIPLPFLHQQTQHQVEIPRVLRFSNEAIQGQKIEGRLRASAFSRDTLFEMR